jgi:hypothetical protein
MSFSSSSGSCAPNGTVSDKPRRLLRHQRAQAHKSPLYHFQLSFMYWLCSKQNCLLCAYECDFCDNDDNGNCLDRSHNKQVGAPTMPSAVIRGSN